MNVDIADKSYPIAFNWYTTKLWEEVSGKNAFETFLENSYRRSVTDLLQYIHCGFMSGAKEENKKFEMSIDELATKLDFKSGEMMKILQLMNYSLGAGLENPTQPKPMESQPLLDGTISSASPSAN